MLAYKTFARTSWPTVFSCPDMIECYMYLYPGKNPYGVDANGEATVYLDRYPNLINICNGVAVGCLNMEFVGRIVPEPPIRHPSCKAAVLVVGRAQARHSESTNTFLKNT
jgi:hypothetical protein